MAEGGQHKAAKHRGFSALMVGCLQLQSGHSTCRACVVQAGRHACAACPLCPPRAHVDISTLRAPAAYSMPANAEHVKLMRVTIREDFSIAMTDMVGGLGLGSAILDRQNWCRDPTVRCSCPLRARGPREDGGALNTPEPICLQGKPSRPQGVPSGA